MLSRFVLSAPGLWTHSEDFTDHLHHFVHWTSTFFQGTNMWNALYITLCVTTVKREAPERMVKHALHADCHKAPVLIATCRVGVLIHLFDIRSVFFTVDITLHRYTHHVGLWNSCVQESENLFILKFSACFMYLSATCPGFRHRWATPPKLGNVHWFWTESKNNTFRIFIMLQQIPGLLQLHKFPVNQ